MTRWLGVVCDASLADGPPAHLDAVPESVLDADLVTTHVDRSGVVASVVVTGGFLRPTFVRGRLVLLVEPVAGGVGPIEHAEPHRCCGH